MDWKNRLYFGDNLDILRRQVPDSSVDLIYLDLPFNPNATYNVLFKKDSAHGMLSRPAAFQLSPPRRLSLLPSPKSQLAEGINRSHDKVRSRLWGYENSAFGRDDR